MEDREPVISPAVLARYAGDAAQEVTGVAALADSARHRGSSVRIADANGALAVTVRLELEWGRSSAEVGETVQEHVREYLGRMTGKQVGAVEVVVERVTAPPA